jgi:hypothetical protein
MGQHFASVSPILMGMSESELFFSTKQLFPRSLDLLGWPLFAVAAVLLVLFTLWSYRGHPQGNGRRIFVVLMLRLLALVVALLTTLRPTVGVQEKPKIPSRLLIGVDLSESMTIGDELGGRSRIDAVRKVLGRSQPILDDLRDDQNCDVTLYGFGSPEFTEATGLYDAKAPADGKKSDYGTYLAKTYQRWQGERFIRGHLILGDGADNGTNTSAVDQAAKWRSSTALHTFAVGSTETSSDRKDVGFTVVTLDPDPVAIKNKVTLRARVNAIGLEGIKVPVKVQFDLGDGKGYVDQTTDDFTLAKATDNAVELLLTAPSELPGESEGNPRRQIKVRVEIPMKDCPGDSNATNNVVETYLNLNKEGLRVLVVNRLSPEAAAMIDALAKDPRIDLRKIDLQIEEGNEDLRQAFNFERNQYDVLVLGNITPKQLIAIDPALPQKIADRVKNKGMGFLMTGGHVTLGGTPGLLPDVSGGWRGVKPIEEILPVFLEATREKEREKARYVVIPNPSFAEMYLTKIADSAEDSLQLWDRLNRPFQRGNSKTSARFTALNRVGKQKPGSSVFLWSKDTDTAPDLKKEPPTDALPLLVGWQLGTDTKGRVLVFTAQDSYLWIALGAGQAYEGKQIHSRFWRQMMLWLAKQDQDDAAAWIRPEFPRVAVGAKQNIRFGLKGPNGVIITEPKYDLRIIAPGAAPESATPLAGSIGSAGEPLAEFTPRAAGEYVVKLVASGKANEAEVKGEATARFIAYAEVSDELQRAAADYDFLRKLSSAGGGQFHRLEDLPTFLNELKAQPLDTIKPKPKYYPDWRRDHSKGFLPGWLITFALLLLAEWGLRRWWGMV